MALLGDDGLGYLLARQLEACGIWRSWLGDSCYANFVRFLESSSSWKAFMGVDDAKSSAQMQLQLRARALLFDKACVSFSFSPIFGSSSAIDVSKINPSYLQLHGDDVYYTLEHDSQDIASQPHAAAASNSAPCKIQGKTASVSGLRYGESAFDNKSQRQRHEEFPDSWYTQFIQKYKVVRPYKLPSGNPERTSGEMVAYLRHLEKYKRRRILLKEDHRHSTLEIKTNAYSNSIKVTNNCAEDDTPFFPEFMYAWNCVPEGALPVSATNRAEDNQEMGFYGVLDTLPDIVPRSRNAIMIERLGIRPESLPTEQGKNLCRGRNGSEGNRKHIGEDQAFEISKKAIARMLLSVGFECATEVAVGVLSQLLTCHISKLGRILKVLADSYKKQCSAIELIRMFLQTSGYSNLGALAEHARESTRTVSTLQNQPLPQVFQSQSQPQNSSPVPQINQVPRQSQVPMPMQQAAHMQDLVFQQNHPRKQRQAVTPRPVMNRERPLVQVKMEAPEFPIDANAFNAGIAMNNRNPHLQAPPQHQQYAAMSNLQAQHANHFRQLPSSQTPQIHAQGMGTVRAPPVKVEAFQELMGGDATPKHDLEENQLTSPSK